MARRHSTDLPTVLLHWLFVIALPLSWSTGMRIAAADDRVDLAALEPLLVQGAVEHWHFASAVLLLMTVCAYGVVVRARSGMGPLAAWHTLRHGVATSTNWALNRLLCWLGVLLLLMAGASGALMFYAPGLAPERAVARLHHWLAWSFPVFLLIHVSGQWLLGGLRQLLKILLPHRAHGRAAVTGGILAAVAGLAGWQVDQAMIPELSLVRVESAPDLDGVPEDPLWSLALPVAVHTVRGANLRGGESEVRVRGVHHDEHAYLLFEWEDPNRSHKFLPLQKTAMGWKLLQTSNGNHDENTYYEDKFAVMLSRTARVGGDSIHLGPHPLENRPGSPNGRGLHYVQNGDVVDVWHWKGTRTADLGQLDDNHFGPPRAPPADTQQRYTGGYAQDPGTGGGFEQNWVEVEGSTDMVLPRRLPKDLAALRARIGPIDANPEASDRHALAMAIADTVPYEPELDTCPIGTILPSILLIAPFSGDRGDVAALARISHTHPGRRYPHCERSTAARFCSDAAHDDEPLVARTDFGHSLTATASVCGGARVSWRLPYSGSWGRLSVPRR